MTHDLIRKHLVRGVFAATIAGVAWHFVVGPLGRSLDREQALAVDQGRMLINARERSSAIDAAESAVPALKARADAIARSAATTSDPSKLYDSITKVARATQVRVDRLDPIPASGARGTNSTVAATDFSIEVVGSYVAVADFLHAIDNDLGFSKVRGFRLTPLEPTADGAQAIRAIVETTHHQVDAFPELTKEPR